MDFGLLTALLGSKAAPWIPVAMIAAQAIGKAIPDDKKGPLGVVRKAAKVAGVYVSNRTASKQR